MPKYLLIFLIICIILPANMNLWAGKEFLPGPGETVIADSLIVGLKPGVNIGQILSGIAPQAVANLISSHWNAYLLHLPPGIQTVVSRALAANPLVDYVEPNRTRTVNLAPPNDTYYSSQWALTTIQAVAAWSYIPDQYLTAASAGTNRIKVAVLDTGVDCTHPDFKNAGGSSTDSAQGGQLLYASSMAPVATTISSPACAWQDDHGHGTHTAGIVAAATQNAVGVASVGYPVQVIVYKILDRLGNGTDDVIAAAIEAAVNAGAQVVSMSLGGAGYSQTLQNAIDYAWQHNTLVVSAAGNTGDNQLIYPGAANHALGVAATDTNNARASFSTFGNWIKIAAPGVSVLSTMPTYSNTLGATNYAYLSGTSMATPHVAAVAGLVALANPNLSAAAIAQRLQRSAQSPNPGWDQNIGYGVLNAAGAVGGGLRAATAGSLVGQVVDATNTPITGASVVANGQVFTTQSDGLFRIANLGAGTYTLTASATGFSPVNMQTVSVTGADTMLTVRMGVATGTFTGVVTVNGAPVSGAVVEALSGGLIQGTAMTSANGTYNLYLSAGTYDLTASSPGDINNTVTGKALAANTTVTVNIAVTTLGNIAGVVKDSNGTPVPNARVDVSSVSFQAGATSDANGNFATLGLPTGTYTVTASSPGFGNANLTGVNVSPNVSTPVTLQLVGVSALSVGLIGYWNFDEGAGSIAHDMAGSGYNGTMSGAAWTAGKINSALSFNGTTSRVVTPNIALGSTFSISSWVNPAVTSQGGFTRIAETSYGSGFYLGTNSTGTKFKFIVNAGSGSAGSCGITYGCAEGGSITNGWHLVTATYDGVTAKLYVDTALVGSDTATAPSNTSFPLNIGLYASGGFGWSGSLDEVRLYNRALTTTEVSAIYNYTGTADTIPPSIPTNVSALAVSSSQINVSWPASTDNIGVTGYQIFRNGAFAGSTAALTYSDQGLTASTLYSYTVSAFDAAGNISNPSSAATATTLSASSGPPTQGLIGYWNFDENSGGIAHDTSVSGYNGTVIGAAWTTGKNNSALSFNGTTNRVVTPNIALSSTFSISSWVNPAVTNQGGYARIAETSYGSGLYLGTNGAGTKFKFIVNSGSGSAGSCGITYGCAEGGTITSGWHLVTATYDGVTAKLYVDTTLVGSDTATAPSNTSFPLNIGLYAGGGFGWSGSLDEVRLYNRALTTTEISAIYNYTGTADTIPPSIPTNVSALAVSSSQINVSWPASTDNVGVTGYQIFRNGAFAGSTAALTYSDQGLTASTLYSYTVSAFDAAGNISNPSSAATATTLSSSGGPPTQGLIGYWNFDENSGGIAHDTSGSGYNGTVIGAAWTTGKINSALSFNGTTNRVVTPNIALGSTFSISSWVNPAVTSQGGYARIAETSYGSGLYLGTNGAGTKFKFIVNSGSGSAGSCGITYGCAEGGPITSGWHLVTATYDGVTAKLYVDAALVGSDTATAPSNTSFPLNIGLYAGGGFGWSGSLDEVRLYNRALTAAEIGMIFNQ